MNHLDKNVWMKALALALALGVVGAGALGFGSNNVSAEEHGGSFAAGFGADWQVKAEHALALAEAMPADKYGFKPTEGMRSFGELMHHIAEANYFFASKAAGTEMSEDAKFEGEKTKEAVLAYMKKSFAAAGELVEKVTDDRKDEVILVFGQTNTSRANICHFMRDHVTHHLGYAIPYLRMAGVTEIPPYGFTKGSPSPM